MGDSIVIGEHEFFHNLRQEQAHQRWSTPASTKEIERHYRARLIHQMAARGIGPVAVCGANDPVDLLVAAPSACGGVRSYAVELKVARAHAQPGSRKKERYQALLQDRRHRLAGDFVIFLCVDRDERLWPFVIPVALVAGPDGDVRTGQRTLTVTSHPRTYRGRWLPFLGAWDYLRGGDMATLADIARDMKQQALRTGRSVRELPRGLEITAVCAGGQWTLTLARPAVCPSEDEVAICRQAFGVPETATRHDGDRTVELRWEATRDE